MYCYCSSVAQSCPTLQPHWLQHTRLPCLSLSPRGCSNSCPLNRWCHPTISSSVTLFSCPQSFPASRTFQMSQLFISGGQSIGASVSASVLPMNIQGWFPLGLTSLISLLSKGSQESSPAPQFKSINSSVLSFLYSSTLTSIHDYWKNHSFDYMDLCLPSYVSGFEYAVWVGHNFPSKEQVFLNFMAAVSLQWFWSPRNDNMSLLPCFSHLFAMKWWD